VETHLTQSDSGEHGAGNQSTCVGAPDTRISASSRAGVDSDGQVCRQRNRSSQMVSRPVRLGVPTAQAYESASLGLRHPLRRRSARLDGRSLSPYCSKRPCCDVLGPLDSAVPVVALPVWPYSGCRLTTFWSRSEEQASGNRFFCTAPCSGSRLSESRHHQ
jgi:hypothetical protein